MSTPRYLAEATTSRVWPCKEYWVGIGDLDLVIRMTWHLPGLNSIFQSNSHSWRVSRSSWSCFDSAGFVMARYAAVSSAKSLTWNLISFDNKNDKKTLYEHSYTEKQSEHLLVNDSCPVRPVW